MSTARNIGGEDLGQITSIRQVGVAAFMGAMIEWYDFFLISFDSVYLATETFRGGLTEESAREPGTEMGGAGQAT